MGAALLGAASLYAIRQLYALLRRREGSVWATSSLRPWQGLGPGLPASGTVLLLACVLAIATVLVSHMRALHAVRGSTAIAFGVFLAPSIWLVWCLSALGDPAGLGLLAQPY